jgi:SNF2 family DNA or RNA helicase
MGLAHPKSLGHGIDGLQDQTNIIIHFGHNWNLGETMQMRERIGPMRQIQAGYDRPVFIYNIVAEDSLDEAVLEAHASKRSVQDALLTAMKRSN